MIGDILQPTHLIFILVVALLVLGPKRLPEVGRSLGRGIRDFRGALSGIDEVVNPSDASEQTPPAPSAIAAPATTHVTAADPMPPTEGVPASVGSAPPAFDAVPGVDAVHVSSAASLAPRASDAIEFDMSSAFPAEKAGVTGAQTTVASPEATASTAKGSSATAVTAKLTPPSSTASHGDDPDPADYAD
jgi:sec-independent protein translocase protein TatA